MNLPDCPIPTQKYDRIVMAHGGGGRMTSRLIEKIFYPAFQNKWLEQAHDGATLNLPSARIAITTDSFVVDPLFFPGGNIGDLAINGTVNDLLCCGATPLYLSAGFILEEGLPIETLKQIVQTMRKAAGKAGVSIVTGDTKVVEHGKCDKIKKKSMKKCVVDIRYHAAVGDYSRILVVLTSHQGERTDGRNKKKWNEQGSILESD